MIVFAFGRGVPLSDYPEPCPEGVPLPWIGYLAHESAHAVYTVGREPHSEEARRHEERIDHSGDARYNRLDENAARENRTRSEQLTSIAEFLPSAERYVLVDDQDVTGVDGWEYYPPSEFVSAVERGEFGTGLPSDSNSVPDGDR